MKFNLRGMPLPLEEFKGGQEAYRRIKVYERSHPSPWFGIVLITFWVVAMATNFVVNGFYLEGGLIFILIGVVIYAVRDRKKQHRRDVAYVQALRLSHGAGVDAEISREPTSLHYRLFQKGYPDWGSIRVRKPSPRGRWIMNGCIGIFIVFLIVMVLVAPPPEHHFGARRSASVQVSRSIGSALVTYANDHNGHFPEGKTSTEVFQHLIDEGYVTDPQFFYANQPGKVRPNSNRLKPENVSWDVTACDGSSAPAGVPLVFLTGYKVTCEPGASALPMEVSPRTWSQWWNGRDFYKSVIIVCYLDGAPTSAYSIGNTTTRDADEDGSIPHFIPSDFDPKGGTYRQLRP